MAEWTDATGKYDVPFLSPDDRVLVDGKGHYVLIAPSSIAAIEEQSGKTLSEYLDGMAEVYDKGREHNKTIQWRGPHAGNPPAVP